MRFHAKGPGVMAQSTGQILYRSFPEHLRQIERAPRGSVRLGYVGTQLQNTEAPLRWEGAVVGEKGRTAGPQCGHELKSIWRLDSSCGPQLCSSAQMVARNLCNSNSTSLREQSLIPLG